LLTSQQLINFSKLATKHILVIVDAISLAFGQHYIVIQNNVILAVRLVVSISCSQLGDSKYFHFHFVIC